MNVYVFGGNYTWTGSTSSNWATSSNWSPAGVPSTNDTVTLSNGGVSSILLDGNRTITRLVISANTIDLNTYELHVSGRSSLNGGAINNGNLKLRGTFAFFQGTNFNCILDVIAGQLKFSGGTFDKTGSFEQNGSASGYGEGGCTFNKDITIKNTGTVYLRLGQTTGDVYNGKVYLYSSGGYSLQMAFGDTSIFKDTVYINSTGSGGINFANGTYGYAQLENEACLLTGTSGITAGTLQLKNIKQTANLSNVLTASGSVIFNVYTSEFAGKVNFTAPNLVVKTSNFNDSTWLTKTGSTLNNTWEGANTFSGVATISNSNAGTAFLKLASQNGDTYLSDVYFNAGTGNIQVAFAGTNFYGGNISSNGNNVLFNSTNTILKCIGESEQSFAGVNTFSLSKLIIDKPQGSVTFTSNVSIDSLLQLTSGILYSDSLITLKASATVSGGSNLSFVDGPIKKIGNTAFVFPVGDELSYQPIEISAPANVSDAFKAQYFLKNQDYGTNTDSTIRLLSTCSYWNLIRTIGTSNVYVYLNWDSIGCSLYDTSGLIVCTWNGTSWKSLGNSEMNGNVLAGKMKSAVVSTSYSSFAWGLGPIPGLANIISINPTLNLAGDQTWNHTISEDYLGYNGASILASGQYWHDLNDNSLNIKVLKNKAVTNLRLNGGSYGNYWDWRTGWFIPENELPNNLFYDKSSQKLALPAKVNGEFVNAMSYFKTSNDFVAGRPIYQLNNLTSSFNYELASLYRAGELNLPVKYIELGNEFYLGDEQYKEIFPSSFNYITRANLFCDKLKSIIPFSQTKVSVIGCSREASSPGRRSLWLHVILSKINTGANRPDAITIHTYYDSGLNEPITTRVNNSNIGKMFVKPFDYFNGLEADELLAVKNKNVSSSLSPEMEVWITEYNMIDDNSKNVGTWAHGLFNAIQTLSFLESPLIAHLSSHSMTSDAVFGNIFESANGFSGLSSGQLPYNIINASTYNTEKYGFTASGAALNEIALALRGTNVTGHRIDFSNDATAIGNISYYNNGNYQISNHLNLYGWSFEKDEGYEAIILNLSNKNFVINNPCSLVNMSTGINCFTNLSAVQLNCRNPIAGIGEVVSTSTNAFDKLLASPETNIPSGVVNIPPYSLTRIIYRNPSTITVRLTDDVICEGTETSVLVQGANHNATITLNLTPSHNISSSDSLFILPTSLSAGTYNITATDGSVTSDPVSLIIHPAMSVTASISSGIDLPACADEDIILTADISTTSSDIYNEYTYLWVPDKHITDNNPFQKNIVLSNSLLTTEAYQVFVFDGQCWASSNSIEFDRGPKSVNLGDDFTVCATDDYTLRANTTSSSLVDGGTLHYSLIDVGNSTTLVSDQTTTDFTISNLGVGSYTYRVEVWSETQDYSTKVCPVIDEITVNVVGCCSCSGGIALNPHQEPQIPLTNVEPIYNVSNEQDLIDLAQLTNATDPQNPKFTISPISGGELSITALANAPTICINGEFWIRKTPVGSQNRRIITLQNCILHLGPDASIKVRGGATLKLKGCTIQSCDGVNMWDGIYADIYDQTTTEPELEITDFNSTNSHISEAKNALVLRRNSPFQIEKCDFENNYVDVLIEKYSKSSYKNTDVLIKNCTFSMSDPLLAPYIGMQKFAAIKLNETEKMYIGKAATGEENDIQNSLYGIYAENANIEIMNTDFHDIIDDPAFSTSGTSIYATSDFDFTNRKITLGDGTTNGTNTFITSQNGLMGKGEMNYYIYKNIFGNSTLADRILEYCIKIENSGGKEILIQDENKFYDYKHGIDIASPIGKLYIHENTFYDALFSGSTNFEGTAINVYGTYPLRLYDSEISLNTIGSSTNSDQPRIGIHLSQIKKVKLKTNSILFNLDAAPNQPHLGIWVENCSELKISDANNIENATNFQQGTFGSSLTGLRLSDSPMSCIEQNTFTKLGIGMHVTGNSIINSFYQNEFEDFDEGIFLDTDPYIGPSVGTENPLGSGDGNVMRNVWNCSSCASTTNRITGYISNGLKWCHDKTLTSDPEFPDHPLTIFALTPFHLTGTVSNDSECLLTSFTSEEEDSGLPLTLRIRNETFGGIVADSTRFPDDFYDEFRYNARQMAFSILKKNPTLIVMDDDSDTSFVRFYNEVLVSNVNKIDSLETLLSERLFIEADTLLNYFTDTNTIEHNYKRVYRLYIKQQLYGDTSLSSSNLDELNAIAYDHPLTAGHAVFAARNMLNLEVHDGELSSARMMQPNRQEVIGKLLLYPNPANEYVRLKYTGEISISQVIILDITGREIFSVHNSDIIDTTILTTGLYNVKANVEGKWFNGTFIISR